MSILHHPSEDILVGHASGRLGRGPAVVVDAHLTACTRCRAEVRRLEALGGALLDETPPLEMSQDALAHALARIEVPFAPPPASPVRPKGPGLIDLLDDLPMGRRVWLAPGVWMRPIVRSRGKAITYVLRSGPGRRLLKHGHSGPEFVCVLTGAFSDETGRYQPGDFAEADDSLVHSPVTDSDAECICLIAHDQPMRMRSLVGRIIQPLVGL